MRSEEDDVGIGGHIIVRVASPISIRGGMKRGCSLFSEIDSMIQSAREIAEDTLNSLPVICSWAMHELGKLIDSIGHIRSSQS